jgi:hypothetical protein
VHCRTREIEALGRARLEGATWIEIGLALGVSSQAARQLYREIACDQAPLLPWSMRRVIEHEGRVAQDVHADLGTHGPQDCAEVAIRGPTDSIPGLE